MIRLALAAVAAAALPFAALAENTIRILDPYAFSSRPNAPMGAAFFVIENTGAEEDRLIAVRSEAAQNVELHTHIEDADGVMRMIEVEDGIAIPAGGSHALERGGDHVMFIGLIAPLQDGSTVPVTLVFENAGEIAVEIPVDLSRMGHGQSHGG